MMNLLHRAALQFVPAKSGGSEPAEETETLQPAKVRMQGVSQVFLIPKNGPLQALMNIDLKISRGEFACIVGPSGCGKSTLLHLIAGLTCPTAGAVWLDGHRIETPGPDRILIFQDLGLFPWFTVGENVEFGLRMQGMKKRERQAKALEYLHLVQLAHFADSYIHQLSGGMRQRVALARALVMEPDVLLMDEPFAALDAQTRDRLHDELERIWTKTRKTIIFVTHNVREAVRLGDRVVVLTFRPGRVKREFQVKLHRPRHLEDVEVATLAGEILEDLREEIDKSLDAEYRDGKKR